MSRLLLLAALGLTTACAVPDDAGLDVSLGISPTPPTVGDTRVVVTLAGPEAITRVTVDPDGALSPAGGSVLTARPPG